MKKFLRGLLTFLLTILFIVLGFVFSFKSMIVNTADQLVKKEMTDFLVTTMKEQTEIPVEEETIEKIKNTIQENESVQNLFNTYFDKIMNVLSSENPNETINISENLDSLLTDGENILKEYGITLTKEDKEELEKLVSSEELNTFVNETLVEAKEEMPVQAREAIRIYQFVMGTTFKIILIGLILLDLLCIALLKKSCYKWLSNLGGATLMTGLFMGIALPIIMTNLIKAIDNQNVFAIDTHALSMYGYILIGIGVLSYILEFIVKKVLVSEPNKGEEQE